MSRRATLWLMPFLCACGAPSAEPPTCIDLPGAEIRSLFSDVIDRAEVQDGARGRAVNHWCRDGRFTSSWETPRGRGQLEGRWWVEGDLRCVAIEGELPDDGATRRCGPIQRCGDRIGTMNRDGGRHGWHVLEPAPCSATSEDAPDRIGAPVPGER